MEKTQLTGVNRWYRQTLSAVLFFLLLLVLVGAIVRASGAGLGCPDWPRCWGSLIPPWKVEQVDLDRLDFEKFRLKAERLGRDPAEVTRESVLASFNPVHTWTEFINRLVSIPIGIFSLASVVLSFFLPKARDRWQLRLVAVLALVIILVNAWMGREIVYSGLKPGIITTHLALAMVLIGLLVYGRWLATERPSVPQATRGLFWTVALLLVLVVAEGIMGAQVREMTDELAKAHAGSDRAGWIAKIEKTGIYLVHRSFSWSIALVAGWAFWQAHRLQIRDWRVVSVIALVVAMMVMGIILGHVAIFPWIQVLHVGGAALLLTVICEWLLVLSSGLTAQRDLLAQESSSG